MSDNDNSLSFRLSSELLRKLDMLRKREDDLPTRGEMLRRLIDRTKGDVITQDPSLPAASAS